LEPTALIGLDAALLDGDDELVDGLTIRLRVTLAQLRRWRRLEESLGEGLVGVADLVERGGGPLRDSHLRRREELVRGLLEQLALLAEALLELPHVTLDGHRLELLEPARAAQVTRLRGEVAPVVVQLLLVALVELDRLVQGARASCRVVSPHEREPHPRLDAPVRVRSEEHTSE